MDSSFAVSASTLAEGGHQAELPPPSFLATQRAAAQGTAPAYQPPLKERIIGFAERHGQLTSQLEKLGDVRGKLDAVQEDIYATSGKVTTQQSRLRTLQEVTKEKHSDHARMSGTFAKRVLNKRGARSRLLAQALKEAEQARSQERAHEKELMQNKEELQRLQQAKTSLELDYVDYCSLASELDTIDELLFDGVTPDYPEDDEAEWEVKVCQEVQNLMTAEASRERRARQYLKDAMPNLTSVIQDIQKALQHCVDIGVPQNTKYTRQLMSNSGAGATVKGTQSLVLNAKTNSGKFFTTLAKARGSQLLIGKVPEFRLIELYLMPGSRSPKAVNERGLHKSLEASYAQAKALSTYLKREINLSLERQKKIAGETAKVLDSLNQAKQECRTLRRSIVLRVVQAGRSDMQSSTSSSASPDNLLTNPMVSTNFREELRKEAFARLHKMISLPEPESEDDNLYPMIA